MASEPVWRVAVKRVLLGGPFIEVPDANKECWLDIPAHESAVLKASDERAVAGVKVEWPSTPAVILLRPAELHLELANFPNSYSILHLPKGIRLRFPGGEAILESADQTPQRRTLWR